MKIKINKLIEKLEYSFSGSPLYGESLMAKLTKIEMEMVNFVPLGFTKSIAKLLQHIIYWRIFTIEKLTETSGLNKLDDWSDITITSLGDWENLLGKLKVSQEELIKILKSKSDDFLIKKLPNRKYDYEYLIEGTIQHDIYHLGQIALLSKQAKIEILK